MKASKTIIVLLILFINGLGPLFAQYREHSMQSGIGIPFFELVFHNRFADDNFHHRLIIMAQYLNDDMTFVKSDTSGYDARFELLLAVYNEKDNVVLSRTINKQVNVKDYALTNSREERFAIRDSMSLPPGEYKLLSKTIDLNSNKIAQRKIKFKLDKITDKNLNIGGILFLQDARFDSTQNLIDFNPTIGNNFSARSGHFFVYFDLYTADLTQPVNIRYKLFHGKKEAELDTLLIKQVDKNITSHLLEINKGKLKHNKYSLEIIISNEDESVKKTQLFSFYWSEVPGSTEDIDTAFQQMAYIITSDSLKRYKNATLKEKQGFFKRFWDRRDPDPNTAKNELKNEYFKRINYANQKFTAFSQSGWATDRGRILVKFGFPDDIERHPFEMGSRPYEVWRYYTLRKTFLFEDRTGFGDYRMHPDFLDVEFQ